MKALEQETRTLRTTEAMCSVCGAVVPAEVVEYEGRVLLVKDCPIHGRHDELLEEDAAYVARMAEYDRPGTPTLRETAVGKGCPYDCGLCTDHNQHTCIALLEITDGCDLGCLVCYANAGGGDRLSLDDASVMLDAYQRAEGGKAEVLQISGGEPTTHPQCLDFIRLARAKGIRYVMLNTNGLRLARDLDFARALGEFEKGFEVYLQFDGLDDEVHEDLRGRPLANVKLQALQNLARFDVPVTLVTTVKRGLNDDQLGRIVTFGLGQPNVRGVNFQPLALFGRHEGVDPRRRITMTGVLRKLEEQLGGMLGVPDFVPLPCDVDRVAITVLLREGSTFVPLTRKADVRQYLPLLNDTMAFYAQDVIKQAFGGLCSGGACCSAKLLKDFVPFAGLTARGLTSLNRRAFTSQNVFRVTVTSFLDRFNFEKRAMQKECVHILTRDGRRVPFSAYNMIHRDLRDLPLVAAKTRRGGGSVSETNTGGGSGMDAFDPRNGSAEPLGVTATEDHHA